MTRLTPEQKITFLKIVFSFMNMDNTISETEEETLNILKTKVFHIDVKDSHYKISLQEFDELKEELQKLDLQTQSQLLEIVREIIKENKYEGGGFFKKSDKELATTALLEMLQQYHQEENQNDIKRAK